MKKRLKINKLGLIVIARRMVNFLCGCGDIVIRTDNAFVLAYHSFADDNWFYSVRPKALKKQLEFISRFKNLLPEDVKAIVGGQKLVDQKSVLVTIDDGYQDVYSAKNIFAKYNIKPILFILSDPKHVNRSQLATDRKFLSLAKIKKLQSEGWIIGCHSAIHPDFFSLNSKQIYKEIIKAKHDLEKKLGSEVKYFCYPKGRYSDSIIKAVKKAGYEMAFSMDDGFVTQGANLYAIPRIGVNNTHGFREFKKLFSPICVRVRKEVKKRQLVAFN